MTRTMLGFSLDIVYDKGLNELIKHSDHKVQDVFSEPFTTEFFNLFCVF